MSGRLFIGIVVLAVLVVSATSLRSSRRARCCRNLTQLGHEDWCKSCPRNEMWDW
jgi:hypothetical protein